MPTPSPKKPRPQRVDPLTRVRAVCLALPETAEELKHTRPAFQVRGKTFVMFMDDHHGDGRLAIWCKATRDAQRLVVESDPERYFVPPYVGPSGWIGVRLEGRPDWDAVGAIVVEGYRLSAPRRVLAALDAKPAKPPRRDG